MSGVELWWLGQAGFRLRDPDGGPVVFVDPFLSPHAGRTWEAPLDPAGLAREADLVLCSHEHIDHFDQPALRAAAAAPGARFSLVVPRPIEAQARALGIRDVRGLQPDESMELGGVSVRAVPARHGVNVADAYTFGEELSGGLVRYLGYVLEVGGVRVYHAGDCVPYPDQAERVAAAGRPRLALLPINGRDFFRETEHNLVGNMDPREAVRLAVDLGAEALVPMHWELFPHNRGFPSELAAYADEFAPELSLLIMGRAGKVVFSGAT
jgi:L-ascorbate metabolism protein UlaG (beta-lactamase superfamily)